MRFAGDHPPWLGAFSRIVNFQNVSRNNCLARHLRTLAIERMLRKLDGLAPRDELTKAAENSLESAFAILDSALADSEFLAGDSLSLADISLLPYVASLPMVQAPHVIESRPHLKAWQQRMSARPSWKKTIALSA